MKTTQVPINTENARANNAAMQGWVMGGNPNAILAQEAEGQQSFVNSETLPTDMGKSREYNTRTILEAAGVKFICTVPDDEMFQVVELPAGWQKKAANHSMYSNLVDDKGRVRASIFYKAAFYDRRANMSLSRRYNVSFDYTREKEGVGIANVTDGGDSNIIFSTEPIPVNHEKSWETSDQANKLAFEWLDQKYPDWRNPGSYWD